MKKASFTLFQPQRWMSKGLSALAVLFMLCLGLQTASAQTAALIPSDSSSTTTTLEDCNATVTSNSPVVFTDDGSVDGNYADDFMRADTITFCAADGNTVKVVFSEFDLEEGDELIAFQGNQTELAAALAAADAAALAAAIDAAILDAVTDSILAAALAGNGVGDAIVPTDATIEDLENLVAEDTISAADALDDAIAAGIDTTGLDSVGVAALVDSVTVANAIAAGFLPADIDLDSPQAIQAALEDLQVLIALIADALGAFDEDGGNGGRRCYRRRPSWYRGSHYWLRLRYWDYFFGFG